MKTHLVCGLWMLLSLSIAHAIWCHECDKRMPHGGCPRVHEFCWADETEGCYTHVIYLGSTITKSEAGCIPQCINRSINQRLLRSMFTCCFTDYCNE